MGWTLDVEHPFGGGDLTIKRFRLGSGLRLILLVDRSAPIFSYQTWFGVGSRHERPGKTGIAHLFEHLMFNQTESLAPGEFDVLIERTGGETNAATWVDWTFYRDTLPARELELAARLESDRMCHLVLESDQLESEREVVIHERMLRVEDDVDGFLDEQLMKLAFSAHPYRWPTIGWMEDIRALTLEDARAFYRTYYAPNNATIVLVGDVDEARALDVIERHYGDIPAAEIPAEVAQPEPPQRGERRERFCKPVPSERVLYGYRAPAQRDPDWVTLEFVASLLAASPSSRLYRQLVVERELATSVDSGMCPYRDPSLFRIDVSVTRGHSEAEVTGVVERELERLATEPVAAAELEKVKNVVETDFWIHLGDCDGKAEALGHYEVTGGDFRRLFDTADRLRQVGADDIMRAARAYLTDATRTVVIAEPESGATPPPGEVRS